MSGLSEMAALTLVSHNLCPYVQRAAISLLEKEISFDRQYVDLSDKPNWFNAISPLGKVPLLQVSGADGSKAVIFESAVILEYLEETGPHPLHPVNAFQRARHRGWIEFASSVLNGIARYYSAGCAEQFDIETAALSGLFERLERELRENLERRGVWFAGDKFSLVDAVFAPVFRYFDTFDAIADFGVLKEKSQLAEWRSALAARPSVIKCVEPAYTENLMKFLRKKGSYISTLIEKQAPG